MKKTTKKLLAIVLSVCLTATCVAPAFAAKTTVGSETVTIEQIVDKVRTNTSTASNKISSLNLNCGGDDDTSEGTDSTLVTIKKMFAKVLNAISNFFINIMVAGPLKYLIPDSVSVQKLKDFNLDEYEGFSEGMTEFIDEPQGDAVWSLGYSRKSIMPSNFGEKSYAKGAYLPYVFGNEMYKDDDGVSEELRVRTIVLDDGSGRGKVAFCAVDAMGLANADVRKIRVALQEFADANNIVSINVSCTHIHTGIDSQGVWTDPAGDLFHNTLNRLDDVTTGVDSDFLDAVINGCKESVIEATESMTEGTLLYSKMDISDYLRDRTSPNSYDENLYKLEFVPADTSVDSTIIATFGCHPESSSYDWNKKVDGKTQYDTKFTADFVWYIEKLLNSENYNFIYLQGNVSTTTSSRGNTGDNIPEDRDAHDSAVRYGYEMGYFLLGMGMTRAERIELNERTGDRLQIAEYGDLEGYTKWYDYENLPSTPDKGTEVKPVLNVANKAFTVEISNNAIALIGKTSISDNFVLRDTLGRVYTVSEVGYMEIGDVLKVYMSPGETFTELLKGGYGAVGFMYAPIRTAIGEDTIIMDLMNDAAGYVANPENYVMAGVQYNPDEDSYDSDTWCLISFGKYTANTFIGNFYDLVDSRRPGTVVQKAY